LVNITYLNSEAEMKSAGSVEEQPN